MEVRKCPGAVVASFFREGGGAVHAIWCKFENKHARANWKRQYKAPVEVSKTGSPAKETGEEQVRDLEGRWRIKKPSRDTRLGYPTERQEWGNCPWQYETPPERDHTKFDGHALSIVRAKYLKGI